MNIKDKMQKERRNEGRINKRKKFYSCLEDQEDRKWQNAVPDDILSHISDFLPLSDFIRFRSVCHRWRKAPFFRSNIAELSKKDVWCIFYDFDARDRDMCLLYQCRSRKSCTIKLPGLRGATCIASKHGWLFVRRNNDYLFFDPLTLEEIVLPRYPSKTLRSIVCQVGTFSSIPTSADCNVALMSSIDSSSIEIASCCLVDNTWAVNTVKVEPRHVARGFVLLPAPRHVFFIVDDVSKRIKRIFICYDSHCLFYDFLNQRFITGPLFIQLFNKHCGRYLTRSYDWYSKMKEVHFDDWIRKFGENFSLSFCLFNDFKVAATCLFGTDPHTTTTNTSSVVKVKAAWLFND